MKQFLKQYLPSKKMLLRQKSLSVFRSVLRREYLWRFNRISVARAVAIGLFVAFIPLPIQMILATLCAISFNANLPVSVALVWVSNPITMPPIIYFCYRVGSWILDSERVDIVAQGVLHSLATVWQPFLLGSFVVAMCVSTIGYFIVKIFWHVLTK